MLKLLAKVAVSKVGGSCYCCCYREPYVEGYEGIDAGKTENLKSCARKCTSNPSIYAGFMSCYEKSTLATCSSLNNQALASQITFFREEYRSSAWDDVDLALLMRKN